LSEPNDSTDDGDRRAFITKATVGVSAACSVFPFAAGVPAFLDPVSGNGDGDAGEIPWSKVASFSALPEDGTPTRFGIVRERVTDAWSTLRNVPVGAVYIVKQGDQVKAFNLKCPHLGCAIDHRSDQGDFFCPCHNSSFAFDGSVSNPASPSPRGMDGLETKIENGFVYVRVQQFRPNLAEKVPLI
jgi:menaquinol-cytochrome c reductase iron-sulfur subunit